MGYPIVTVKGVGEENRHGAVRAQVHQREVPVPVRNGIEGYGLTDAEGCLVVGHPDLDPEGRGGILHVRQALGRRLLPQSRYDVGGSPSADGEGMTGCPIHSHDPDFAAPAPKQQM